MTFSNAKLSGLARLPLEASAICVSYMSIDSVIALARVDRGSRAIFKKEMARLDKPIATDSVDCSRLLTGLWNIALRKIQNPREALRCITRVVMKQGLALLQTPTDNLRAFRYFDEAFVTDLQSTLKGNSHAEKVRCADFHMSRAVATPRHEQHHITFPSRDQFDGVPLDLCFNGTIIENKDDTTFWEVQNVVILKEETSCLIMFQAFALSRFSNKDPKTWEQLTNEINADTLKATPEVNKLASEIDALVKEKVGDTVTAAECFLSCISLGGSDFGLLFRVNRLQKVLYKSAWKAGTSVPVPLSSGVVHTMIYPPKDSAGS